MGKVSIDIDYSNICKDYNTSYLDRDNKDPATAKCMKQTIRWITAFLSEYLENFGYSIYKLQSSVSVQMTEVASNRFLFYSLEKEITLQSYVLQQNYVEYASVDDWKAKNNEGILISNDEDGQCIYVYVEENSDEHAWITKKLKDFLAS